MTALLRSHSIHADELPDDPLLLAASWLPAPGEPPVTMTVSTVDEKGRPNARTLLLSDFTEGEFRFHTDSNSAKASELAADPHVALTVLLPECGRQIVVRGKARVETEGERERAYAERSSYLRTLAWLNTPEYALLPADERTRLWAAFQHENPDPQPPGTWIGYAVAPSQLLFWEANPAAAGRRVGFVRTAHGWDRRVLPG